MKFIGSCVVGLVMFTLVYNAVLYSGIGVITVIDMVRQWLY